MSDDKITSKLNLYWYDSKIFRASTLIVGSSLKINRKDSTSWEYSKDEQYYNWEI